LKNDEKTANIMIDLGYVLFKFADYYKSIAHLKKGIELADKINNNSLKKQGYNYLHKVYYKTGDFRKAYEILIKYAEINENISLSDLNKTISEMQIKLDFDKKQSEIDKRDQKIKLIESPLSSPDTMPPTVKNVLVISIPLGIVKHPALDVVISCLISLSILLPSTIKCNMHDPLLGIVIVLVQSPGSEPKLTPLGSLSIEHTLETGSLLVTV
jgi:tetratricopeptide (TPR) repeat protein